MKSNASLVYNLCLVVGDFLALVAAFVAAYVLRVKIDTAPLVHQIHSFTYLKVFLAVLPFWILIFALIGLYNSNIYERRFNELGRLLVGSFIGLLFVIFWNFVSKQPIFPARLVPIYGFIFGFVFVVIWRNLARLIRTMLFRYGIGLTRVLIVGNTKMTSELVSSLSDKGSGYRVLGAVTDKPGKKYAMHIRVYKTFDNFLRGKLESELHGIIQTELFADETKNREILEYAQTHHINYRFIPGNTELFVGNLDVELFRNSIPVIAVRQTSLFGWGRIIKRMFDVIFGGILLVVSSPLWLVCGLAIKLTDPSGPVFYRAKRLSRFGNPIYVYKFRTMKQAYNNMTPEAGFAKMGKPELAELYRKNGDQLLNDPRISLAGKVLRASSLDELPQLFNVFRGDISLVGPRALDIFEIEKYTKKDMILSVKSGLTGLAVVSGRKGISFEERRKLDLYYVQNWSFWLDVVILTKTARVVLERLAKRGARY